MIGSPEGGDRRRDEVDEVNRLVAKTFTVHREAPPVHFVLALEHGRLLDWSQYTEMLFDLALDGGDRQRIRGAYERACAKTAGPDHLAAAGTAGPELQCADEREFTALLKSVQLRSGLSPAKIGELAGIPRSQAYSMITRGTLPTRFEQVVRFVEVCGLPENEVYRILELWLELRQRGHRGADAGILWVDCLDYLRERFSPDAEESPRPADGHHRAAVRSRRLNELSRITNRAREPEKRSSPQPKRARPT